MKVVVLVLLLSLVFASCSGAIFNGNKVSPGNNPPVEKYHTDTDTLENFEKTIGIHIVPGIIMGVMVFIGASLYFTYRWCRACFCCCCKKNKVRGRSGSLDEEIQQSLVIIVPAISWTLRITIFILFVVTLVLMVVGFVGSDEYHTSLTDSTKTAIVTIQDYNTSFYNVLDTMENLIGVPDANMTAELSSYNQSITNLSTQAQDINSAVEHIDGIREHSTMVLYVATIIPMIVGLIGAAMAKGRLAFIMSAMLPLLIFAMWMLFSFHYALFIVNVDACYVLDTQLTNSTGTDKTTNTSTAFNTYFNCSSLNNQPLLNDLSLATNLTLYQLNHTQNATERQALEDQLVKLNNATATVQEWNGCDQVTDMLTKVYGNLCGTAVQASMFMWQSQIGVAVLLILLFVVGIIAEHKVGKKLKHDYSALIGLINE